MPLSQSNPILIPYVKGKEGYTVTDDVVDQCFYLMVRDNTLSKVFYDGKIKSPDDLRSMLKDSANLPVFITDGSRILGFAWINGINYGFALAHFCYFREAWGEVSTQIGQALLDYWFSFPGENGPLFDVIVGMIPEFNTRAIKYTGRLGFELSGKVPMMARDAKGVRYPMVILHKVNNGKNS